jgi:hypothetical protein
MAVTLYRQVGKGKSRRYKKVNLGKGRRPADLTGPYFLRYSLIDGTRPCCEARFRVWYGFWYDHHHIASTSDAR